MIGNKIKKARLKKGLSQQQLAKIISTSKQNISSYERDITSCPNDILLKLSEVLDTDFNFTKGGLNLITRLTKEENRLIKECIDDYMEHVSIIDLAPVIKRKLDVFEETNLNTFTLKELDILIDEVIDDIYIDFNKPENRYLLDDENENLFDNMISKFTCLKSQILESFPEEIKNNFEYISSINVEVSNINEKVYEYEYYYDSVIHEEVGCSDSGNRIYKLEDLNYEYYLGLEDLNYYEKMYTNYFKISYIKELWNANKHMILYSITNKDDNTQGYIAIERASEEINTEYMVNTNLYDNDEKHLMYSPKNIGRVLTVLGLYFNTFRHEYEIVRKLTEEELIKILNRAEDEHKYYSL